MAKKQQQVKQVWFTDEDEQNFELIAEKLKSQGIDVEPDNRKASSPYSHTKVIRYLLTEAATQVRSK